ncbi:hypothetical protein H5410_002378, partial [Solanum commersonii]
SPSPIGESLIGLKIAFCSSVLSPERKDQVGDEMELMACRQVVPRSSTISPNNSKCKKAEGIWILRQTIDTNWQQGTRRLKRKKKQRPEDRQAQLASCRSAWRSPIVLFREALPYRPMTQIPKRLKAKRGHKTKTTKLIAGGFGSTWVQPESVNPSHFPTYSAQESEWANAEYVLNAATRCSREIELIRGKLLKREFTPL